MRLFVAAPERGHRGQDRLFVEEEADQVGDVGVDLLVIGDAGSRRVDQGHSSLTPGPDQPWHPQQRVGIEHLGIEEEIVDATIDDVYLLESLDGPGVDAVVVQDHQVATFDQLHAQLLGQKCMFEVRSVVDARRQHHDGRVAGRRRNGGQQAGQPPDIGIDRFDAVVAEQLGKDVLGHHPVLEQVGHSRWHPQVVLEYVDGAVDIADQITATDMGPDPAGWIDAHALPSELGIRRPTRKGPRQN